MSSATGLFYAYAKQSTTDWAGRHLIVFLNRATADEWWRAVTDSVAAGYTRFDGVQRLSHQYYLHNPDVKSGNITQTINDEKCAKDFLGRVFFTLLDDRDGRTMSVAPVLDYTDHISGHGFFIHSSLQGDQYWFYDGGKLGVSRTHRTKFTVSIQCQGYANNCKCKGHKGTVMIGTDPIIISAFGSQTCLGVQCDGQLTLGPGGQEALIKFSDFDGGFQVTSNDTLVYSLVGGGDRWELV